MNERRQAKMRANDMGRNQEYPASLKKNRPIFVDIEGTIVYNKGSELALIETTIELLIELKNDGHVLILWSTAGTEYCEKFLAEFPEIKHLFDLTIGKPLFTIDDLPIHLQTANRKPPYLER